VIEMYGRGGLVDDLLMGDLARHAARRRRHRFVRRETHMIFRLIRLLVLLPVALVVLGVLALAHIV
jgi:hypothetical protein